MLERAGCNEGDLARAVDLFSGSGAVTTGLSDKFRVVAAVDSDPLACSTYAANHPEVHLYQRDIRTLDAGEMLRDVPAALAPDLMVVCAPCQPFSNQNQRRGGDPRALLVLEAVRFAEALRPKGIFFENVPGLAGVGGVHAQLSDALAGIGYHVGAPRKLDAADLGVPQRRVRCVMFAARSAEAVGYFARTRFKAARSTVRETIGDLRPLESGERDPDDPLHAARRHTLKALERLRAVPADGGSRSAWPVALRMKCHENKRGYPDVYGRMAWNDVAPTLTTGCTDVTRGRFAHPEQDRAITLREAALLHTFPRGYLFHGSVKGVQSQIGNAVPVAMVRGIAPTLSEALRLT